MQDHFKTYFKSNKKGKKSIFCRQLWIKMYTQWNVKRQYANKIFHPKVTISRMVSTLQKINIHVLIFSYTQSVHSTFEGMPTI